MAWFSSQRTTEGPHLPPWEPVSPVSPGVTRPRVHLLQCGEVSRTHSSAAARTVKVMGGEQLVTQQEMTDIPLVGGLPKPGENVPPEFCSQGLGRPCTQICLS